MVHALAIPISRCIDRDNGSFLITDRFFRLWIQ